MPRLNHGTLLENLVVLEVTRVLATKADTTCEFAAAFAMPPLTQWWHKSGPEAKNNPKRNRDIVTNLLAGNIVTGSPTSYSALLRICLANAPRYPVVPYASDAHERFPLGGPNGALLAAMLRCYHGQPLRLWCNDLAGVGRYRDADHGAESQCVLTGQYAVALTQHGQPSRDDFCGRSFPDSVANFAAWRRECEIRVGFLDPDAYTGTRTAEPSKVSSAGHCDWLTNLHIGASSTAGIMFFASQDAPGRPALITAFHTDIVSEYPRSVVFLHGNYMVGVKLRGQTAERAIPALTRAVADAWAAWSSLVNRKPDGLAWCVDGGEPATH